MNTFSIKTIKTQPPNVPLTESLKCAPALALNIQSIVCMNYPIQTLMEVLTMYFQLDEQQKFSPNLVIKTLKVISISLKDAQLKKQIQKILNQNMHKRNKIYDIFVYWSSFVSNFNNIFGKMDSKLVQNLIAHIFSQYCLTQRAYNLQISKLITLTFQEMSSQEGNRIAQLIKNEFLSMNCPLEYYLSCATKFDTNNQKLMSALTQISVSVLKSKQSQNNFNKILGKYFQDQKTRDLVDRFLQAFPSCIPQFITNLNNIFETQMVFKVWQQCNSSSQKKQIRKYKMQLAIRSAIKQWVNASKSKQQYWHLLQNHYNIFMSTQNAQGLISLLQLGYQIQEQKTLTQFICKIYIFNIYRSNTKFDTKNNIKLADPIRDMKLLQKLAENKQKYKKMHMTGQIITQMLKCMSTGIKNNNIQLFIVNKIHSPQNWVKNDISKIDTNHNIKMLVPYIEKINAMMKKIQENEKQKGKKLQLAFHGIIIQISVHQNKKTVAIVSLQQLLSILSSLRVPSQFDQEQQNCLKFIQKQYSPAQISVSKQQIKKQLHSIVIEAKIVRIMKKAKKKLNFQQIYSQIINQKQFSLVSKEAVRISIAKVIDRGLIKAQGTQSQQYIYCP